MTFADDDLNRWQPDPYGRFEERYFVYGEPSRLVRTAGIEAADPHGVDPIPEGSVHVRRKVAFVRFSDSRDRSTRVVWAVFAGLCATVAILFLFVPVSATADARDLSTVTISCGSVVRPTSSSHPGVVNAASSCGSRRLPLAGVSLVFGVLVLVGAFRSVAVANDQLTLPGETENGVAPAGVNGNRGAQASNHSRRSRTNRRPITDAAAAN
jgi:hypothetical protein